MTGVDRLIAALTLAKKGMDEYNLRRPTHCEHDQLTLCSDPNRFTEEEIMTMESLGFYADMAGAFFYSFEFGSA